MLNIKANSHDDLILSLSGGNQQKVILGRWLTTEADILIMDNPTQGIDVGAKAEIYKLMNELAKSGIAIVMVSSEMEELLGMSDRLIVLHEGRQMAELKREDFSQETVMRYASGIA